MGQQQLLLLVLGAIIVGVAIVIGINMFQGSSQQANEDAVRQELITMAGRAQEWFRKPKILNGGGQSFAGLDFIKLGYSTTVDANTGRPVVFTSTTPTEMVTQNGTYNITAATGTTPFTITGKPSENTALTITVTLAVSGGKITTTFTQAVAT